MSERIICPGCGKDLAPTNNGRYRKHKDCDFSQTVIQEEVCSPSTQDQTATSQTASSAESSPDDVTENASSATSLTPSSPDSPEPEGGASTASAQDALPGSEEYAEELSDLATEQLEAYKRKVESKLKPFTQPTPPGYERQTLFSQPVAVSQTEAPAPPPATPFSQPAGRRSEQPEVEMSTDAASIAARLKELFYAYDNRRSADNRSAQVTMGPSEMGTPCDRRLALSLMRTPPVNPGGDGWAAFVGTSIHAGLEQMFMWADAGTGRFAVEQRLDYGSAYVPKGTADLIDRTLLMVLDHKCMGRWSRNKLKTQGPSPTYKVQAHVYAYGARLRGEKIEKVAIVSWPRDEATLDDLYVHVEDYNPLIAKRAFERVEKIGSEVGHLIDAPLVEKADKASEFTIDSDSCRFCPFFLPGAKSIRDGCNGKR